MITQIMQTMQTRRFHSARFPRKDAQDYNGQTVYEALCEKRFGGMLMSCSMNSQTLVLVRSLD
jgi:hypothetical protein